MTLGERWDVLMPQKSGATKVDIESLLIDLMAPREGEEYWWTLAGTEGLPPLANSAIQTIKVLSFDGNFITIDYGSEQLIDYNHEEGMGCFWSRLTGIVSVSSVEWQSRCHGQAKFPGDGISWWRRPSVEMRIQECAS